MLAHGAPRLYRDAMFAAAGRLTASFAISFVLVPALLAQKYTPKQITFSGYSAASQSALLAASGLKAGEAIGQPEIQAAAQKLSDTGLFSDIRFSFNGVELHYTLKPADGALPVNYENFPWWTTSALNQAVAARVPLFSGSLIPETGLQAQVVDALTALLQQKGITAKVVGMPLDDAAGNLSSVSFRIVTPAVQIGSVMLNAAPGWAVELVAIEKAAEGQDYGAGTKSVLDAAINAVYHRKGYLDVTLGNLTYGQPLFVNGKVTVPLTATIEQGAQYRLSGLHLSGDVLMTPDQFAKDAKIHPGDIVNEDLLHDTLANVSWSYKAKGYLYAKIAANPVYNRAQHTVDYSITVTPGPVYRMGKLTLANLSPDNQTLVMKYWTMRAGDIYDATYPSTFLNRNKTTLHALDGWSANYKQLANQETHIVDLVITFQAGGPLK